MGQHQILIILTSLIFMVSCQPQGSESEITVRNDVPRMDDEGNIVDAHDGRVIQFGDRYYWYGTAYANTNGFVPTNHYRCYSSDDMTTWKYEGRLLPNQPEGVYYRPHVIYNAQSEKYVLWYNWYPELWGGQFGVAVSDVPEGPYEIVNDNVQMANSEYGLGDFGLFVDDDGTGYISYNTIRDHMVSVEKLSEDFLSSALENGGVIAKHVEAGSQFKRNGIYYLLTDYTCCFCNYGSGARVYMSDQPLGPYRLTGNINRYPGRDASALKDDMLTGTGSTELVKNNAKFQSVDIAFESEYDIRAIDIHVFTGNRNGQCGEVHNPRVHPEIVTPEFTIESWSSGTWMATGIEDVGVSRSALSERVTMTVRTQSHRIRITPNSPDTTISAIYLNEVVVKNEAGDQLDISQVYVTGKGIPQRPIVPAQQTYVMQLQTADKTSYIWMGDLWGSASDNVKGHDYQYWSAPFEFRVDGTIEPLRWTNSWNFKKSDL